MMTLGTILKFGPLKKAFVFSQAYPILMIWSAFKISKYITKMKQIEMTSKVEDLDIAIYQKELSEFVIDKKSKEIEKDLSTIEFIESKIKNKQE